MVLGQGGPVVHRVPGGHVHQGGAAVVGAHGGGAHPQEHLAPHVQGQGLAAGEGDESIPGGGAGVPASGTRLLLIGGDLVGEILGQLRLPLGGLHKTEVREIAEQHKFVNARKHDSQDICFVPDGDYARFMEDFTGKRYPAGDFLDENGRVVGTHNGAVRYTIGQRKGLGLAMGAPVYVCGKDMQANTVTVGPEEMLFDRIVYADEVNWIAIPELTGPLRVTARTRYHQVEQAATVYPAECGFRLEFDQPQRAPTPGQAVVLYQGDTVLGGGTITRVEK